MTKIGASMIARTLLNMATNVRVLPILVSVFLIAAHAQESSAPSDSGNSQYFPAGVFDVHVSAIKDKWYSTALRALQEPSLFALRNDKSQQVYRFLWLPSFHHPISVRLTINIDGSGSIVTRSVDRHTGLPHKVPSDTGKFLFDKQIRIGDGDVERLLEELQRLAFWSMPTEKAGFGADGAQWILEGVRRGEYHIVDRWSPDEGSYSELCKHLLRLAAVEREFDY